MSAAVPSAAVSVSPPVRVWWRWPHLLALDSVAVAMVWLGVFAGMTRSRMDPAEWLVLGAAVWLVYMADRLLDARVPPDGPDLLRERHRFTATHRRWLLPLMLMVAAGALAAVLLQVPERVARGGSMVALLVAGYFLVLRFSRVRETSRVLLAPVSALLILALMLLPQPEFLLTALWTALASGLLASLAWAGARHPDQPAPWVLPRKLAGGLIFATGTAAAPYFHPFQDWTQLLHGLPVLLFGCCCAMNSLGIRLWENPVSVSPTRENRLLHRFYPWLTGLLAAAALGESLLAESFTAPALRACAVSAAVFTVLHLLRQKISAPLLSMLADAALFLSGLGAILFTV